MNYEITVTFKAEGENIMDVLDNLKVDFDKKTVLAFAVEIIPAE